MRRYLQTFFRHPWLYLLPMALVLLVAALSTYKQVLNAAPYSLDATIAVNLDPAR